MMPQQLSRPPAPKKGSFWANAASTVGYVPLDPGDHSKGYIGSVRRLGKQYKWTAWTRVVKPNTTMKAEPVSGSATNSRLSRKLSQALWALRKNFDGSFKTGVDTVTDDT
jgi:predicted oxidoreductase